MAGLEDTPRWLALDGAANARAVVPGVLLRADNLQSLSARDVRLLIDEERLEVVLDPRTDIEVRREGPGPLTAERGVRIEHRSLYPDMADARELDQAINPWVMRRHEQEWREEPPAVRSYLGYLLQRPDSVIGSLRTIARSRGAVLVHCAAGKDRTGIIVALALDAAGFDRELIVGDFAASSERVEAIVARLMGSETYRDSLHPDPDRHLTPPETIERFFEIVDERFGGSVTWLTDNGFADEDLALLRRRLGAGGGEDEAERAA